MIQKEDDFKLSCIMSTKCVLLYSETSDKRDSK